MATIPKKTTPSKKRASHSKLSLEREVALLRSYVIGTVGQDTEGTYRPEFVERVLQTLSETDPTSGTAYTTSRAFLDTMRKYGR